MTSSTVYVEADQQTRFIAGHVFFVPQTDQSWAQHNSSMMMLITCLVQARWMLWLGCFIVGTGTFLNLPTHLV